MEDHKERELLPDLLRGFAVILVVFGHCIQEGSGEAYRAGQQYFSDRLYQFIYSFHMPLFMMISGYLSWNSIIHAGDKDGRLSLVRRRAASLLVPVFAWTALDYMRILIVNAQSGKPQPEALVFVYFYNALNNLWFLWAVWWCFLAVFVMRHFLKERAVIYVLGFLVMFVIPDGLGLGAYKYMLPYYLFGYYMHDSMQLRGWNFSNKPKLWMTVVAGLAFIGLFRYYNEDSLIYLTGYKLIGTQAVRQLWIDIYRFLIGLVGSLFFVFLWQYISVWLGKADRSAAVRMVLRFFQLLGVYSMGIYIVSGYLLILFVHRLEFIDHPSYVLNVFEAAAVLLVSLSATVLFGKVPVLKRLVGK